MSIRVFSVPFLLVLLIGCGDQANWETIEIGKYEFDFPPGFELVEERGIDSYVGRVVSDSMSFGFDYGYYSSDFAQTPDEYLEEGDWRYTLWYRFAKSGITYDATNTPGVEIIDIRPATNQDSAIGKGCDYVARCKYDTTEYDYPVYIPNGIKQLNFEIDTFGIQYRKIVIAQDPEHGITGIYLRDLNGYNQSMNSYLALSMATGNLTKQQQEIALKIFRSGRLKE